MQVLNFSPDVYYKTNQSLVPESFIASKLFEQFRMQLSPIQMIRTK